MSEPESEAPSTSRGHGEAERLALREAAQSWWPSVDTEATARGAARQGVWAAVVVAALPFAFGSDLHCVSTWVQVLLFGALALGISRMSRLAALGALSLCSLDLARRMYLRPNLLALGLGAAFVLAFLNGLRGTLSRAVRRGA